MDAIYEYAWMIPVLPLMGAMLVGLGLISFNQDTNRLRGIASGFLVSLIGTAMVLSYGILASQISGHEPYVKMFEWASAGDFKLQMGYIVDPLTSMMLVVVTTVALLVMIYTDGYMAHDPSYVRFYAYLSLFSSSMLGLVISPNLVQVYVFWELVGMCSYLLIGFWYDRKAAADACQKAFVTNRVGDFGLLLGILGLFWATRSFDFDIMGDRLQTLVANGSLSGSIAALFAILVFLGPVAKSAQFPLHVWLPDAMEGPTPISALIHAATMVAAGVFLIARMFPVFHQIPIVMDTIAWTGAITAFIGATTAITQNDIKKGLAYSTMSQLGYMVLAMGVGAYSAGLFHLVTHAFFKAMLFLGSGSVIHGMEEAVGHNPAYAQDMRLMGGLRKLMPITATTFLIGTLAICGIPPFAGFWSKDEILHRAYEANPNLWFIGFVTAGITAFYMFRMYFQTFEGELRAEDPMILSTIEGEQLRKMGIAAGPGAMNSKELGAIGALAHGDHDADEGDSHDDHHAGHHGGQPHESPLTMTLPLMVLAIPSMFIGLLGTPFANYFEEFIHAPGETFHAEAVNLPEFLIMGGSSVGIGLVGISIAILMYLQRKMDPQAWADRFPTLYALSKNKWYFDEIYDSVFVRSSRRLARQVLEVDYKVVDGVVNLTGFVTLLTGEGLKYVENGRAQFYALIVFGAVIVFVIASSFA